MPDRGRQTMVGGQRSVPRIRIAVIGGHGILGALILLFVLACGQVEPAATEMRPDAACQQGDHYMEAPEIPAGVLLQSLIFDAHDRVGGYRIYADGRYESQPLGEAWTFGPDLTPTQMAAVKAAIAAAGLERLSPRYQPAPSDEDHSILWMQVVEGQTVRSVAIEGSCQVPEINTLSAQLVEIFKK